MDLWFWKKLTFTWKQSVIWGKRTCDFGRFFSGHLLISRKEIMNFDKCCVILFYFETIWHVRNGAHIMRTPAFLAVAIIVFHAVMFFNLFHYVIERIPSAQYLGYQILFKSLSRMRLIGSGMEQNYSHVTKYSILVNLICASLKVLK